MRKRFKIDLLIVIGGSFFVGAFFIMATLFVGIQEYGWASFSLVSILGNVILIRHSLKMVFLMLDDAILWK